MEKNMSSGAAAVIRRLMVKSALSHAYIISGPAGSGRHELADWMAAYYVCSGKGSAPCGNCPGCRKASAGIHPDIIRAGIDGKPINVAAVRALRADAYIRPNEAPRKVYLFERAQEMNPSAQNALLKVLEDGPPYASFLLLTENDVALLPTIRSRCEILRLNPLQEKTKENGIQQEAAANLTQLLLGGNELELLAFTVTLEKMDRASFADLLDETVQCLRDKLVGSDGDTRRLLKLTEHIGNLRRACDFNIGTGHLAGWLAARACEK